MGTESAQRTTRDYSHWYPNPTEDAKLEEELGAENERIRKQLRELDAMQTFPEKPRIKVANDREIAGDHYQKLNIQPWDAMQAWMTPEQFKGFLVGNCIKYVARAGKKGGYREDIEKAQHYLEKLLEVI